MKLPKELTKVTPLSKTLALILFIILPILGFFLGISYQQQTDEAIFISQTKIAPLVNTPNNNLLQILSPKAGEVLCIGKWQDITWQVPSDMSAITLKIGEAKGEDTIHDLGNFPANYNSKVPGQGTFRWKVGYNRDNAKLILNPGYHIIIQGGYKDYGLSNTSRGSFTITNC